jgi:uncharacterized Ntn-hydrolase superfamily protein
MKNIICLGLLAILMLCMPLSGQSLNGEPFTHTFSIVAIDQERGEMGVAVQSHWFSVGSIVTWAEPGVGAIATQSLVNVSFGPRGLEMMKSGESAGETLSALLESDEGREFRQVGIVDAQGNIASYTGKQCIADASHIAGKNYSVQANMMLNKEVVPAMSKAFENSKGPLAERMLAALKAAQKAGGDIRGQQSAAILVVKTKSSGKLWEDRLIDLRVEDHPQAVNEIERILKVFRAYEHMNNGDLAIEKNDEAAALEEYGAAQNMFPENIEMKYWTAVSLANIGKIDDALPVFKEIFAKDENWRELTRRIAVNGMLTVSPENLNLILVQ